MEDAQIIAAFQQRDEAAIAETKRRYEPLCMTVAYNILGSHEDAEECFHDALLHLWNAIPPAEPVSLGAFLLTAVRNAARDRLAGKNAQRRGSGQLPLAMDELSECIPSAESPDKLLDSIAIREALRQFLGGLRPAARKIFVQRYYLCLSITEIAKNEGCAEGRIHMSLMRTRKRLRKFLEQEELL